LSSPTVIVRFPQNPIWVGARRIAYLVFAAVLGIRRRRRKRNHTPTNI
jgi:hypothetical protein